MIDFTIHFHICVSHTQWSLAPLFLSLPYWSPSTQGTLWNCGLDWVQHTLFIPANLTPGWVIRFSWVNKLKGGERPVGFGRNPALGHPKREKLFLLTVNAVYIHWMEDGEGGDAYCSYAPSSELLVTFGVCPSRLHVKAGSIAQW